MKTYLTWAGGTLILLILVVLFTTGTFQKYGECKTFYVTAAEAMLSTPVNGAQLLGAVRCVSVEQNLFLAYYFIALGVAFLTGGLVMRDS